MKKTADLPPLTCSKDDVCVWFNFQTLCIMSMCLICIIAGAAIISVTVVCEGEFSVAISNGTLVCGNTESVEDAERPQGLHLGGIMRIILVLTICLIIILVTIISLNRVVLRERHRNLSGQLTKLMEQNGIQHLMKGGSQIIFTHDGEDNIV